MPFTFAHPVATLPWWTKKSIPVSALIIGCMSPDFEYFVRFRAASIWSHEGAGIILFNLPMIMLLYVLFERFIRPVIYDYLPGWFPYRWKREGELPASFKGWSTVLILGMAGVCTHLIWDQFTHKGAWVVNHIPMLTQVIQIGSLEIPVYKLCQHGSTLLGLLVTLWWIHRHLFVKVEKNQQSSIHLFWLVFIVLFVTLMIVTTIYVVDGEGLQFVLQLIVPAVSCFLLSVLLTCLIFLLKASQGEQ